MVEQLVHYCCSMKTQYLFLPLQWIDHRWPWNWTRARSTLFIVMGFHFFAKAWTIRAPKRLLSLLQCNLDLSICIAACLESSPSSSSSIVFQHQVYLLRKACHRKGVKTYYSNRYSLFTGESRRHTISFGGGDKWCQQILRIVTLFDYERCLYANEVSSLGLLEYRYIRRLAMAFVWE